MPESGRKAAMRVRARRWHEAFEPAELDAWSRLAQSNLLEAFPLARGTNVALYAGIPGEVGTGLIAAAVRTAGGTVFYPTIGTGGRLTFIPVEDEALLAPGRFGIPAPVDPVEPGDHPGGFDLVVVPGLAFDRAGYRLGRGGGYYDRFLPRTGGSDVVGLAFSWQLVEEVPRDPWDVPVGAIVTEKGVIRVLPGSGATRV